MGAEGQARDLARGAAKGAQALSRPSIPQDDPPILRRQEAGHRPQDRGLAGSGGSDQGERLPADLQPDGQGEPRQTMPDVDLEDAVHPSRP